MRRFWQFGFLGAFSVVSAMDLPQGTLHGGVKLGYSLGQNGAGWPKPWVEPLKNENRGGFSMEQARLRAEIPFDSSFDLVGQFNFVFMDLSELYVQKQWGTYLWKLGKFIGAGPRTGTGTEEFSLLTVRHTVASRVWSGNERMHSWSDYGLQVQRSHFSGLVTHRLFIHNANGQFIYNDDPNGSIPPATQTLGLAYGWEWKTTQHSLVGGHLGARADKEWDEFVGRHDFWEATYWFKSNPIVDGSLFHEFDVGKLWVQSEFLAILNRAVLNPEGLPMKTWGISISGRYTLNPNWSPYARYEFFDWSDGVNPGDAIHLFNIGTRWTPKPQAKQPWNLTVQYSRNLEEEFKETWGNDVFFAQLQAEF